MRRGVTILELLVAVGVVALLLALSVPALRGARERAVRAADLSNLRTSLQDAAAWSNDHQDRFLNDGPNPPYYDNRVVYPGGEVNFDYMAHGNHWPFVLAAWVGEMSGAWFAEGSRFLVWYSAAMYVDPEFFGACQHAGDWQRRFYRYVAVSETAYPAVKAKFLRAYEYRGDAGFDSALAFVDGSAAIIPAHDSLPGLPVHCGFTAQQFRVPGMWTRNGIHGRDVVTR